VVNLTPRPFYPRGKGNRQYVDEEKKKHKEKKKYDNMSTGEVRTAIK
jgi:hypothetical protein